jgi:hypothetical protein
VRWCSNCRMFNVGAPQRCRYCSAGLEGRLCPAGHVNPPDKGLVHCGQCGRMLEARWGSSGSWRVWLVGVVVMILTLIVAAVVANFSPEQSFITVLMVAVIMVLGFRFGFSLLPSWVRDMMAEAASFLLRMLLGRSIRGKK